MRQAGATLHRGAGTALHRDARASHYRGLSCCGAQAPDAQAQQWWLTGPAAPWHVGSSQTRARTRVPCISRRILNHCATREALPGPFTEKWANSRPVGYNPKGFQGHTALGIWACQPYNLSLPVPVHPVSSALSRKHTTVLGAGGEQLTAVLPAQEYSTQEVILVSPNCLSRQDLTILIMLFKEYVTERNECEETKYDYFRVT